MPAEYFERPMLYEDLRDTVKMFHDLSGSRPVNFGGPGAIPISEIRAYFDMFGITSDAERQLFLRRIRILDGVFLRYHHDKNRKERDKRDKKGKGSAGKGGMVKA